MTLPQSDAQPSRSLPRRPEMIPPTHSMSAKPPVGQPTLVPFSPPPSSAKKGIFDRTTHEHAIEFATNSWDLATGGLKTLTAKRELPTRHERRNADQLPDATALSKSYMLALVILACVVLMLIGGGVALIVLLQQP